MFRELSLKSWNVGGSIRNEFLGKEAKDLDFVVEDTTEEEFLSVFPEAKKVGNSFPVFLLADAEGNEHEVALARTEQSTGDAYTDFEFVSGVSIHEDLSRRDFTINSMARNVHTGELVDPHNGLQDLHDRVIRTINTKAFEEDSLRIYRGIRFAAEFEFEIEESTLELMRASKSKLAAIPMERVAAELKKVYERTEFPSQFFELLLKIDALQIHFKPLYVMSKVTAGPNQYHGGKTAFEHAMNSFNYAKEHNYSFDVALAGLFHDTGKGVTKKEILPQHIGHEIMSYAINKKFVEQHRFTAKQNELIVTFARHHMYFHLLEKVKSPIKLIRFFKKIRKHADEIILAANTDHELTEEKLVILENLKRTFKETVIDIPKEIHKRGNEAVINFVENQYAQKYKEIVG
jgi:tRNA nucleotidyltransferase (CCA-adding enzyme)